MDLGAGFIRHISEELRLYDTSIRYRDKKVMGYGAPARPPSALGTSSTAARRGRAARLSRRRTRGGRQIPTLNWVQNSFIHLFRGPEARRPTNGKRERERVKADATATRDAATARHRRRWYIQSSRTPPPQCARARPSRHHDKEERLPHAHSWKSRVTEPPSPKLPHATVAASARGNGFTPSTLPSRPCRRPRRHLPRRWPRPQQLSPRRSCSR